MMLMQIAALAWPSYYRDFFGCNRQLVTTLNFCMNTIQHHLTFLNTIFPQPPIPFDPGLTL